MFQRGDETGSEPPPAKHPRREGTLVAIDTIGHPIGNPDGPGEPFPRVFARIFPALAELQASFRTDGLLAAVAWDGGQLSDYLHIRLEDDPEFVILGRHDACDLSLAHEGSISLRHALVGARAVAGELQVRLLDLRSGLGFVTEDGRRCEAVAADGPLFVRVGGYHLFLLPTGSLAPWPWLGTAEETWQTFPERIYRDCRLPSRAPEALRPVPGPGQSPRSVITRIIEPPGELRPFRPAPGARGARVATIELAAGNRSEHFAVHKADLERGLLIGRYDRCQLGAADDSLSRVHLLVVCDGDETWAVDTASTNGTMEAGQRVRRTRLGDGSALLMGHGVTLKWATT